MKTDPKPVELTCELVTSKSVRGWLAPRIGMGRFVGLKTQIFKEHKHLYKKKVLKIPLPEGFPRKEKNAIQSTIINFLKHQKFPLVCRFAEAHTAFLIGKKENILNETQLAKEKNGRA